MIELSCIYKIVCKNNNKFYIGSTVNVKIRLSKHKRLLKQNKHTNKHLQNCWNKYGEKNFRFEIIETIHDISQLLTREKWWLNNTKCYKREIGFNISPDPNNTIEGGFINLIGQKFNMLTPIKYMGKNKWGQSMWLCKCDCGKEKIVQGNRLKNGGTRSCGCLYKKCNIKHGRSRSKAYSIWQNMIQRCQNPNFKIYKYYGGEGITVCNQWDINKGGSFENFYADVGEIPKGLTLDRIDNNGNYSPDNWQLVTRKEQGKNRRNNKLYNYNGEIKCGSGFAEKYRINRSTLESRLKRGLSIEKALTIPVRKKYRNKRGKANAR